MAFLGLLAGPAGRWLALLLLALAVAAASFVFGIRWEQGREAERLLDEERRFSSRMLELAARDRALAGRVAGELAKERAARAAERSRFEEELANAKGPLVEIDCPERKPAGPPEGERPVGGTEIALGLRPSARLSATACRLWNSALSAGTTVAERAGWLAGGDPCTGPIEIEEALWNLQRNAELLGECRSRERATHRWMREVGLAP